MARKASNFRPSALAMPSQRFSSSTMEPLLVAAWTNTLIGALGGNISDASESNRVMSIEKERGHKWLVTNLLVKGGYLEG